MEVKEKAYVPRKILVAIVSLSSLEKMLLALIESLIANRLFLIS